MTLFILFTEPRKEKTDVSSGGNGTLSPSNEQSSQGSLLPSGGGNQTPKLERPNSLGQNKVSRRILCYHGDHCMFKDGVNKFVLL